MSATREQNVHAGRPERATAAGASTAAVQDAAANGAGPAGATIAADVRPLEERVRVACAETDWHSFLPSRAGGLRWRVERGLKRLLDLVLVAAGIVVLLPLIAVVAILVKATSRGPVFYAFTALGRRGEPFTCYKFRTMQMDASARKRDLLHLNEMTGPAFKIRRDPRVTPLGRFLRKSSLDELPQLWNVLRGEMSLVGPRPPLPEEFVEYEPWHRGRLAVTPGMTCYWQVLGRNEIHDFDTWMRLDRKYVQEWNVGLDLLLLARTVPVVLSGHGAY